MAAPKTAAAVASRGAFQVARVGQKVGRCSLRNGRPKRQQIAAATTFRRQSLAAQTYHEAPRRGMQHHAKVGKVQAFCKTRSRNACVGEPALPVIFLFVVQKRKILQNTGRDIGSHGTKPSGIVVFCNFFSNNYPQSHARHQARHSTTRIRLSFTAHLPRLPLGLKQWHLQCLASMQDFIG